MYVVCRTVYFITLRQGLSFNQTLTISTGPADQQALSSSPSALSLEAGVTGTRNCARLFVWVLGTAPKLLLPHSTQVHSLIWLGWLPGQCAPGAPPDLISLQAPLKLRYVGAGD